MRISLRTCGRRFCETLAPLLACIALSAQAGGSPQVDLSVSVAVSPPTFVPGGTSTVALTVHNAGPDAAGTTTATPSVVVYGGDFVVTHQPPPYEVVVPASGCGVERFVSEPLPDANIRLVFIYYFDTIAPGQSRTCTFDVQFDPSTVANVENDWEAMSFDTDVNPSNNVLPYTFFSTPAAPASTAVPTLTTFGNVLLGLGLAIAAIGTRRRARAG